ncbi:unnamed protein product, partial [Staurois parvus]
SGVSRQVQGVRRRTGCHLSHGVTPDPLHEKVSCKESRRSSQDGSDLWIGEHNGSESDPLCSICRSHPLCGDRRRGCHQMLSHRVTPTL